MSCSYFKGYHVMEFEKICICCGQKFYKPSFNTQEQWEKRTSCSKECEDKLKGVNSCGSVCNVPMKKK